MLNDATCFKAVYIVCGYTDLRSGMDRLAALVEAQTGNKPYVPDTLYLFCGRRTDRIKGLVWEHELKFIRFITIILKNFLIFRYKKSTWLENQSFIC